MLAVIARGCLGTCCASSSCKGGLGTCCASSSCKGDGWVPAVLAVIAREGFTIISCKGEGW